MDDAQKISYRYENIFVDRITFLSLLHLLRLGLSFKRIWYFEPISALSQRLLRTFLRVRLMRAEIQQIPYNFNHVRDESGRCEYLNILDHALSICSRIKEDELSSSPLINRMKTEWAVSKVVLHFEGLARREVRIECLRIGMVKWMLRNRLKTSPGKSLLLIERKRWFSYLKEYALSQGIKLFAYRSLWTKWKIEAVGSRLFLVLGMGLYGVLKAIRRELLRSKKAVDPSQPSGRANPERQRPTSTVAIDYGFRKVSFDSTERSEFFWLNVSGIPYSEVILYHYVPPNQADVHTLNEMNKRGVKVYGHGSGVSQWYPTYRVILVFFRVLAKLTLGVLICLVRGQKDFCYYFREMLRLAISYSYWHDFFSVNGIKVKVSPNSIGEVGNVLALDALNGISASFQYSSGVLVSPYAVHSFGENVQFVFSGLFEELWHKMKAPVDNYVRTGFIDDYALQVLRYNSRAAGFRKQLHKRGVTFILCFFDENSLDRWDIYASNEAATRDYEYLFDWLLSDPTLGLLFKPKRSVNLFERIGRISKLIEQAERSGRCRFLTSDTLVGSIFPTEAALMADVCIGKLLGSASALEARLAGVPTVMIDVEGFRNHPFHAWGRGRVVFDDWESLRVALEQYRAAPEAHPEFGDWSPGLNDLDPFRDGQASVRMGLYIRWAYEALKQGEPRQTALAIATGKFAQRWGNEHMSSNQ